MEKRSLGKNGPLVSRLCFGTLPMGPLGNNLPLEDGAELLEQALENGVNFFDTAEAYLTYKYLRAVAGNRDRDEFVIASKSHAVEYDTMKSAIENGLDQTGLSYFDVFQFHAPNDEDPFVHRAGALRCMVESKRRGLIRQVGVATHCVNVVNEAAERDDIDVVFAIVNRDGWGILNGSTEDMLEAVQHAHECGKGVFAMKALAGGNLIDDVAPALEFVRKRRSLDSVAVGMATRDELGASLCVFNGRKIPEELESRIGKVKKIMHIRFPACRQCGTCIEACPNGAISMREKTISIDRGRCILCGYCAPVCPDFNLVKGKEINSSEEGGLIHDLKHEWIFKRELFEVDAHTGVLRYRPGDRDEAERLVRRLPKCLSAFRHDQWVGMDLEQAHAVFEIDFKKGL